MPAKLLRSSVSLLSVVAAASCARDVEKAKREHVERGDRYMTTRTYDAAIIEYRNAVQQDPALRRGLSRSCRPRTRPRRRHRGADAPP